MIKIIIIELKISHCHIFCRRCVSTNACQILYICNDILEYFLCMVQLFQNLFKINQEPSIEYISISIEICIFRIIVMYFYISQLKLHFCTAWFVPNGSSADRWVTHWVCFVCLHKPSRTVMYLNKYTPFLFFPHNM